MAQRPGIKIRYNPVRTYDVFQGTYVGAQTVAGRRGWWPFPDRPNSPLVNNQLAVHGGHLVIGGAFTTVGGQARVDLAVVQVATGLVTAQSHAFAGPGTVACVETDGTYAYVGGNFSAVDGVTSIAGRAVAGLVRFDYDGVLDLTWNPSPNAAATAVELLRYNPVNGTMYVAGDGLTTLNGTARTRIGEVSLGDAGNATAWTASPDARVYSIMVDAAGARVYLGGDFANIDAAAQVRLVRMTMTGVGVADAWAPAPSARVHDMVKVGDLLFCVGLFATIGTVPLARAGAASVNPDGTAGDWNPTLNGTGFTITAYRDLMLLGGTFTLVGATTRNSLAAVTQAGAGTLQAWNPNADAIVTCAVLLDRTLYVGGLFTAVNGNAHANLAAIPFPIFTDANTKYVAKTGSNAAAGTAAAPYLTLTFALTTLAGAFTYIVIQDSGTYDELLTVSYNANEAGGIFAADGQAPILTVGRGALAGTYGARVSGRTKFSTGAPGTFIYVSKLGNNATGVRGDSSKPFLTITGALGAAGRVANDTVQIQDSGIYREDVNTGALAVTIQAKNGEIPTLANVATANLQAAAGVTLNVYGLAFEGSLAVGNQIIVTSGNMDVYDCTLRGGNNGIEWGGAFTLNVINCSFAGQVSRPVQTSSASAYTFNMTNCFVAGRISDGVFVGGTGATVKTVTISMCTFKDTGAPTTVGASPGSMLRFQIATGNHVFQVKGCEFLDTATIKVNVAGIVADSITIASTLLIENTLFEGLGSSGYLPVTTAGPVVTGRSLCTRRCVSNTLAIAAQLGDIHISPNGCVLSDIVSLDAGHAGILSTMTPAGSLRTITGAVIINAASYGLRGIGGGAVGSTNVTGLAESGSGINSATSTLGAFNIFSSILKSPVGANVGLLAATFVSDPELISTAVDSELVGLAPTSPGIALRPDGQNIGITVPIVDVTVAADPFDVDGVILEGDKYFYVGLRCAAGLASRVALGWCTFRGLSAHGAVLTSGAQATACLFDETNGTGLQINEGPVLVERTIAQQCAGAGVLVNGQASEVQHVTAFGNAYGQADTPGMANRTLDSNVLAGNGSSDYAGSGNQSHGDVPRLEGDATVTDGTRLEPLFRDVDLPDLRLQAIAAGYAFDSPAIGLASDGGDAGAFDFYYGPLTLVWTVVDLGLVVGAALTNYRNPQHVTRKVQPLKLFEGETFGGITYSEAAATFKRDHVLTWEAEAAMPVAQVADLVAVYQAGDGETQISLDGGTTWIPTRVLRSQEFSFTELGGATYSGDTLPTPVGQLVFRESE